MWFEVHYDRRFGAWFLYEGTEDGYKLTKIWQYKWTAKIWSKVHGVRFYN